MIRFGVEWTDALERKAAELWRKENPTMSVFDCDEAMKNEYRRRIAENERKK